MKMSSLIRSALTSLFASADSETDQEYLPMPEVLKSDAKQHHRDRFRDAVAFAKEEMKNATKKKYYAGLAKPRQSAYNVAFSMFFKFISPKPKYVSGF